MWSANGSQLRHHHVTPDVLRCDSCHLTNYSTIFTSKKRFIFICDFCVHIHCTASHYLLETTLLFALGFTRCAPRSYGATQKRLRQRFRTKTLYSFPVRHASTSFQRVLHFPDYPVLSATCILTVLAQMLDTFHVFSTQKDRWFFQARPRRFKICTPEITPNQKST